MKHAFIAPINYLHLVPEECDFHLVLAHLLKDKTYVDFYKKRKAKGDFIILDNSAFEFKRPVQGEEILKWIDESGLEPDVVVAPDYPFQKGIATVKSTEDFITRFQDRLPKGTKVMSVPQSEKGDVEDWISTYQILSTMTPWIGMSILGLPNAFCFTTGTEDISYNRLYASLYLVRNKIHNLFVQHHYLGLGSNVRELALQQEIGIAYSNDSSSAFWHAINGVSFDETATGLTNGKIKKEVDFHCSYSEKDAKLIKHNISFIQNMVK